MIFRPVRASFEKHEFYAAEDTVPDGWPTLRERNEFRGAGVDQLGKLPTPPRSETKQQGLGLQRRSG
jgi:hypothetical protein